MDTLLALALGVVSSLPDVLAVAVDLPVSGSPDEGLLRFQLIFITGPALALGTSGTTGLGINLYQSSRIL